ncbi:putative RNA methyltransferase At5g10620 isoform X2 [Panicum virgatum]|uniref:Uncharacterized protein n=1 Tax=Panicum virgatum TaxID=38727 RepID=A0A8T0Q5H7_PANVG|nr:putative RNA methyltransferase At5g10620 isoform X2 [Panicum virgatum]KAG2568589.1 hypothetical protein PVAP13_7NG409700 [Panicum virgatum]KAG2568591.1 hypothetical protein PVAP13_7NG409700 [Panicum virgatum]KAG2568593.1 hypothetical protein PVAP13_7NG409700 [Panicum virgatum]KAG2568594.1 hypothetical protein PVAP13_7NG409700 [Panicum virgatum]KAG2568595.1 hypothetical protein PVAP13_7NG409700 [Panicum virgatum]
MAISPFRCICGAQHSLSKDRGAPAPSLGRRSKYSGQSVVKSASIDFSSYIDSFDPFLLKENVACILRNKAKLAERAMPMRLLTVGKKRSRGTQLLVEEYKEKLGYYCDFEDTLIRSNPKLTSDVKVQVEAEDTAMMQQLKPEDFVVVLDENGNDVISE